MGRPKGSPNKMSYDLRQDILDAFDRLGGTNWLVDMARQDPRSFIALLSRCLPQAVKAEISGVGGGPIPQTITIELVRPSIDCKAIKEVGDGSSRDSA